MQLMASDKFVAASASVGAEALPLLADFVEKPFLDHSLIY
jgi:hypothetical protein